MAGIVTINRNKKVGYQRTYGGIVEVCCHRVTYWYNVTGVRLTSEAQEQLEIEAEERAQACIVDNCSMGDLNCVLNGETEVWGAWYVNKD